MKRFALRTLAIAALGSAPVLAADAPATQPTVAELQEQIQRLERKIEQLETRSTQPSSKAVTDTVERVLRDSEQRSNLLQLEGFTAGFSNDQFYIGSADGNWSFIPHLMLQFRNTTNFNSADDDVENGFEVRRLKFIFDGTAVTKDLFYHFQWNTGTNGGTVLDDAFLRYTFPDSDGFQLKGGQYKDPWFKEETTGDQRQLAAERSLLNSLIAGGVTLRVQGVSVIKEAKHYRAELMYHDGANSLNTNFQDGGGPILFLGGGDGDNFGVAARFDWFVTEKSKEVDDFTALGNKENLLVFGAGAEWTQAGDSDAIFHTVDAQWETTGGLGVYGALTGVYREIGTAAAGGAPPVGDFYDWGVLGQVGYVIPDTKWEVFGRYDVTFLDDGALPAGSEDTVHEVTGGVNYYFYKHNVKMTLDLTWLPNGSPVAQPGLGVLAGDDDQFIIRGQVQLFL